MNRIIPTLIVFTAYAPTLLLFTLIALNSEGMGIDFAIGSILFILVSILSVVVISGCSSHGEVITVSLKKIESYDSLIIPFVVTNGVPAILKIFGMSIGSLRIAVAAVFILAMVVSYTPIHPVLIFFGFKFYKCETSDGFVLTLICKRSVRKVNLPMRVVRISENLYLEKV